MKIKRKFEGFTLMETVVALLIAAIALSFFLAAFVPATLGIKGGKATEEAILLSSALEAELNTPRQVVDEAADLNDDDLVSHFEKAFAWISQQEKDGTFPTGEGLVFAFQYKAAAHDLTSAVDGIYPGYDEGDDFADQGDTQPMVIKSRIGRIEEVTGGVVDPKPLDYALGSVFAVSLTQIIPENDPDLAIGGVSYILDEDAEVDRLKSVDGDSVEYDDFMESNIMLQADFYLLESNAPGYLQAVANGGQPLPDRPIFSKRMVVNR